MKPYQQVPIAECGEPLLPIPLAEFAIVDPHPYVKLAAPYDGKSPYYLRRGVLERLLNAQNVLQRSHPGWRIQIFDAYRPRAVQQYMVDYTFAETVKAQGKTPELLSAAERQDILGQVYQFWAVPSDNPATPPPHSTGAAVDVTIVDVTGQAVEMGSPIDEMSPRSYPDHFASAEGSAEHLTFHRNRQILKQAMLAAGFRQAPEEWWHFSWGDQFWAWLAHQDDSSQPQVAHYGAI
ncbi:D-alanyl-D-alanine dipeptidase [Phormidium tenue FACHB-886]|nr:D-alanyl-D-alanine dipeptidase [Phormidium tenue FACHB-886]